ncbi:MAG: hypothetical protein IKK84_03345 [Clostridia bacterium]|nr:hypothetical protein [Clostridia bacterium]MBR6641224.1 hypothetical protein [Clostridia bacterium]
MKKSFYMNIIAIFMVVFLSFNFVYADTLNLPLETFAYNLEDDGHYKSMDTANAKMSFTYDADSIDFKYVVTKGETTTTYTTSFALNNNVLSYTYTGDKTNETQIKVDKVAFESVFYAVGQMNLLQRDFLEDMNKDFSRYNFDEYGIEVKTFDYGSGKKGIESFKLHTTEISAYGTSVVKPVESGKAPVVAEPVAKGNPTPVIIACVVGALVVVAIIIVVAKGKKAGPVKKAAKKPVKKAATKKTK